MHRSRSPSFVRHWGRVALPRRSGESSVRTSDRELMVWPSSRAKARDASAGSTSGLWSLQDFPRRTTLPELRAVPVTELPGVGPRIAAALKDLAIVSIADLVSHYPSRHEDLSNVKKISNLRVGERATVLGRGWLLNQLVPDTWVVVAGEVQRKYGLQLTTKSIEVIDDPATVGDSAHAGRFVPVYPVSKGINARRMRTLVHRALEACGRILDPLPAVILAHHGLPNLHDAMHEIHFPSDRERLKVATRRLVFHELFLIQTGLAARKARLEKTEAGQSHRGDGRLLTPFLASLPFGLTGAQERVIEEVLEGMRYEKPMRRLLQGDVGSGKSVVAVAALLSAVESGGQSAIMAPTEV